MLLLFMKYIYLSIQQLDVSLFQIIVDPNQIINSYLTYVFAIYHSILDTDDFYVIL